LESTSGGVSYEKFYVTDLNIDADDFKDKNILDIGCGPRGSLEWADMSNLRVGLDPLVNEYFKLNGGTLFHKMHYVRAYSESMPFADETFDFVFSINSLDYVDDLDDTIHEIKRVLKIGGICGIIVDANHKPTACEPISIDLNLKDKFSDIFEVEEERVYEVVYNSGFRDNLDDSTFYDFNNPKKRPAILLLKLKKVKEFKSTHVPLDEVDKLRLDNERLNSKISQYKNRKAVKLADKTKSVFKR
jgi:ubiquinone/menaquinone biosynthesis C-methylase UbiE